MARRGGALTVASLVALLAILAPVAMPGPVAAADEYGLATVAEYEIRPEDGEIGVTVQLEFTNTTPDPPGSFSVFEQIRLAVQDEATGFAASDDSGSLRVFDGVRTIGEEEVHVATVQLRQPLRSGQAASAELSYVLPDGAGIRARPSVVVFPAWSFGTEGEVRVLIPDGYEMRVDGDPLEESGDWLESGPIEDPTSWLSVVTAVGPGDLVEHEGTVPLEGGTADLLVRSFRDDEEWGTRTLDLVTDALPLIEEELGLPYPVRGQLVLTQSVALDQSGFGEITPTASEIAISFEQPPFTALHQVTHVWLTTSLVEARWINEGLASHVAATVGADLGVEPPYDPAEEAGRWSEVAFPLDAWPAAADRGALAYGYAASWATLDEIRAAAGEDALRTVLGRVASSIGPYESAEVEPAPQTDNGAGPLVALSSRLLLDHLETVSDADLTELFAERVFTEADAALLPDRDEARAAYEDLIAAADGWGAPDPVNAAMTEWRFAEAMDAITDAREWLTERDELLSEMTAVGLNAPDRLQQAYRAYGGGSEAGRELAAEAEVVSAYAGAAERVNGERSFIERLGLVGGPDPQAQLVLANGQFTNGSLGEAIDAVREAERIVASAEGAGIVRIVSLVLVVLILIGLTIVLFRRRAYTSRA